MGSVSPGEGCGPRGTRRPRRFRHGRLPPHGATRGRLESTDALRRDDVSVNHALALQWGRRVIDRSDPPCYSLRRRVAACRRAARPEQAGRIGVEENETPAAIGETRLPILRVTVCGRDWELERETDLESLWAAMTSFAGPDAEDERLPYWTELWPSSLVLAEWLYEQRELLRGRNCLDLGCGIGLTALVGRWIGACVLGMDYEMDAVRYARRNAARNAVPQPGWAVMDWRRPAVRAGSFAFVWGGDIMYECRFAAPLLDFLDHALAADGAAWIAEPSRSVYATFRAVLADRGWTGRCVRERDVAALYPQAVPVPVRVWEIGRAARPASV